MPIENKTTSEQQESETITNTKIILKEKSKMARFIDAIRFYKAPSPLKNDIITINKHINPDDDNTDEDEEIKQTCYSCKFHPLMYYFIPEPIDKKYPDYTFQPCDKCENFSKYELEKNITLRVKSNFNINYLNSFIEQVELDSKDSKSRYRSIFRELNPDCIGTIEFCDCKIIELKQNIIKSKTVPKEFTFKLDTEELRKKQVEIKYEFYYRGIGVSVNLNNHTMTLSGWKGAKDGFKMTTQVSFNSDDEDDEIVRNNTNERDPIKF